VVPQEDATFAVSEIERRANDPAFAQIDLAARENPLKYRRHWPSTGGCVTPSIALHVQGFSGGHASTGSGHLAMQEHYATATGMPDTVTSRCSRACSSASRA
jgi:hypothetical protein